MISTIVWCISFSTFKYKHVYAIKHYLFFSSFHFFVAIENVIMFLNFVYKGKQFLISILKMTILLVLKKYYIMYK